MENTTSSNSAATSNTRASMDSSSVDNLSLNFGNLRVRMDRVESNGGSSLSDKKSLVLPSNGCLTRTQQEKIVVEPKYETKVKNSIPVPSSLHSSQSQSIWAAHTSRNRGETWKVNSGFAAPPTSNNAANGALVRKDYMLRNNLDLKGGAANQDSSVCCQSEAIDNGLSDQEELTDAQFLELHFWSLKGYDIIMLALTPSGSQRLQRFVSLGDPKITNNIFEGVIGFMFELITHKYGNYPFVKLIESCDDNQLQLIVAEITLQSNKLFVDASNNKYGSYSLKKLIKLLERSPLISNVILALHNEFYAVMTNRKGSYVVLKCLDLLDSQTNDLLYQAAINYWVQLATNERGCLSLNNFITNSRGPRREQLLDLICRHSVFLSQDPSGNFVLQHVLGLHNPIFIKKICSHLKGHYIRLSLQKVGSHVVENCLRSPGIGYVLQDFIKSDNLLHVARDQYGNYVIQTALRIAKETSSPFYQNLLMRLEPLLDSPKLIGHGRNVYNMIVNEIPAKKP